MEHYNNLETFRDWFVQQPISSLRILECRNYGKIVASVVYRNPPYQVELVIGEPNAKIPAHRHPNIDAFEVHISGDLRLIYDLPEEAVVALLEKARPFPERFARGKVIHVRPNSWHAAIAGPTGASFWSVQKWEGDVPLTAAGENWEGEVFSEKQLKEPSPYIPMPGKQFVPIIFKREKETHDSQNPVESTRTLC